jgi:hypothetical protein
MAKIDTKARRAALSSLIPLIKAPENMRAIGELAASMIKLRTRLGYGVAKDGDANEKLKPLSANYVEQRQQQNSGARKQATAGLKAQKGKSEAAYIKKHQKDTFKKAAHQEGGLHPGTSPKKSNLTRSGQLLDSEGVTKVGYGTVSVGPSGSRADGKTNQEIAGYVSEGGRPFNHLSKVEIKRLQDSVKKQLRDALKRVLTK